MNRTTNILDIHNQILKTFQNNEKKIRKLSKEYKKMEKCLEIKTIDKQTREYIQECLTRNQNDIESLQKKCDQAFYFVNMVPLLQKYKEILSKPVKMVFFRPRKEKKPSSTQKERNHIEEEYLRFISEYNYYDWIPKDQTPTLPAGTVCSECESPNILENDDYSTCCECGLQQLTDPTNSSYLDVDRTNVSTKYSYDRKFHFIDSMKQFQGKQKVTIPDNVYEDLKRELKIHYLVDEALPNPYQNVTKQQILMFLKETRHNKHYENINLIYRTLTSNPVDDITHLEERLIEDFNKFAVTYDKYISNQNQKRNFNYQYILYQLLKKYKYPCDPEDFNCLKTVDRQILHDEMTSKIFQKLGWRMYPFW